MAQKERNVRVKLLQGAAGPEWVGAPGDTVWLAAEAARQLVEAGFGELVEDGPGDEAQEAGVVEPALIEEATAGPGAMTAETATGPRERKVAVKRPTQKE